ncbi:hypothetical protein SAMN05661008_00351 [Alkalithermobacter thermoalcaliphilus JW-YL-7 = DSM 7308]|uniref:Uncharacterized protein n=1 Tax=Alkalithermobacter thermoalcaliphilus JW-YL-7 = DSM 7308 TaxID=1121328 RepID=A0A150FPB3_CLOPD|nr:hypothetical protein JWYL7_0537 [[Clostridium] paradoxum JW-YL-7 = DSM 7308]SHK50709.1 hypothetical protein SAMN05661008_00351 [[Clostridium] paradoxum JW-YL-7 = DSM 7308]
MRFETLKDLDIIEDCETILEYEAVFYMIRKERNKSTRENQTLEDVYKYMDKHRIAELREEINKEIKTKKLKIERMENKKKREKEQAEYLQKIKEIKEDREKRDITQIIKEKALSWGENGLLKERFEVKRTFSYINIITQNTNNIRLFSNKMAINHIRRNNYFKYEIGKEFECELIENNIAWISQDETSEVIRYFTKNKETGEFAYFDLIDLIQIELGCNFLYALREAMEALNIKTEEEEHRNMNVRKYVNNIEIIEGIDFRFMLQYPNLYKLIGKHFYILEKMNTIGIGNIRTKVESLGNDAVFFSSYQYIADFLNIKSKTTVANAINMFALLGLITKVENSNIPSEMMDRAKKEAKARGWKNLITFFTIPLYTERILRDAEAMAGRIIENKITISNISIKRVEDAFGEEIAERVYGNTKKNTEKIIEIKNYKKNGEEQMLKSFNEFCEFDRLY